MTRSRINPNTGSLFEPLPEEMSFDDWVERGNRLLRTTSNFQWQIGDWWHYGSRKYRERVKEFEAGTFGDYSLKTLENYGWVAGKIETSRRREVLSFAHHAEVARMSAADQDRWLEAAVHGDGTGEDEGDDSPWTVKQLRERIKAAEAEEGSEDEAEEAEEGSEDEDAEPEEAGAERNEEGIEQDRDRAFEKAEEAQAHAQYILNRVRRRPELASGDLLIEAKSVLRQWQQVVEELQTQTRRSSSAREAVQIH